MSIASPSYCSRPVCEAPSGENSASISRSWFVYSLLFSIQMGVSCARAGRGAMARVMLASARKGRLVIDRAPVFAVTRLCDDGGKAKPSLDRMPTCRVEGSIEPHDPVVPVLCGSALNRDKLRPQ